MTIDKFGNITPVQGDMLKLIGYRISWETTLSIPDEERMAIMLSGRKSLCETANVDLGYDLLAWHHLLIEHEEYGYTHPYAFEGVKEAVLAAGGDEVRTSLVSRLLAIEKSPPMILGFGALTLAQMAMLRLIGYRFSESEATLDIPDQERIDNMLLGRRMLWEMTYFDLEFDLSAWYELLIKYDYITPDTSDRLLQVVQTQQSDAKRAALIAQIQHQPNTRATVTQVTPQKSSWNLSDFFKQLTEKLFS